MDNTNTETDWVLYKNVLSHLNEYESIYLMDPPRTVFDDDYDYTKWNEVEDDLKKQHSMDDIYTLLILSNNVNISQIKYYFSKFLLIDIFIFILLGLLFSLFVLSGQNLIVFTKYITLGIYILVFFKLRYYVSCFFKVELYNPRLICKPGISLWLLIASMINLLQIIIVFIKPKYFFEAVTLKYMILKQEENTDSENKSIQNERIDDDKPITPRISNFPEYFGIEMQKKHSSSISSENLEQSTQENNPEKMEKE